MGAYFQSNPYPSVSQPWVPIRVTREMDRVVWTNSLDDSTRCKVWRTVFCPFLLTLKSLYDFGQGYMCKQTLGSAEGCVLYKAHFTSLFDVILSECNSLKPGVFPQPVYKGMKVLGSYPMLLSRRSVLSTIGPVALCHCQAQLVALRDTYTKLAEAIAVCVPREGDGR